MVSKKAPHSGGKLPDGWALKIHESNSGSRFKYYENSKIGQKFFSKDDIIRYIKMFGDLQPNIGPISRLTENSKMHNSKKATNEDLEWLPRGWIIHHRTIKRGPKRGKIYMNYVDQSSGRKFDSKVGVLRFLEDVKQERRLFKQKIKRATKRATTKVVIETSTEEDLPPGWIKELRIKKLNGRIRRDPFYTDPETGYVFRSKRDVQRYLETGEISQYAFLPQKRHIDDENLQLASAKCDQLIHDVNKKDPQTDTHIDAVKVGYNLRRRVTPKPACMSISLSGKNVTSETTQLANLAIKKFQKCPSDNMVDCAANDKEIIEVRTVKRKEEMITNRKSENTSCHSDKTKAFILPQPERSSKRLAGLEPEQVSTETSGLEVLPLKELGIRKNKGKIGEDLVLTETSEAEDLPLGSKKELKIRKNKWQIRENPSASVKCEQPISQDISLWDYADKHIDVCKVRSRRRGSTMPSVAATSKKGSSKSISAETEEIPTEKLPQDSVINGGSESESVLEEQMVKSDEEKRGKRKSKKGSCMFDDKKGLAALRQHLKQAGFEVGKVDNSASNAVGIEVVYDSPINKLLIPRASKRINCRKVVSCDVPVVATEAVFSSHDETVVNVEATVIQEKDVLESARIIKGKTHGKESSSKCKMAIEIKYQRRSSNRLAGLNPTLMDNSQPCAQVTKPDFYTKESERHEILALTGSSDFKVANANNEMHVETSSNSQLSLTGKAISKEQQDEARTDKTDNQIPKESIIPQSTNFYSDPCIEFAFKTLTGEIPIENFMDSQLVSTSAADCGDDILHRSGTDESRKKETSVLSSQYNTSRKTVLALRCSKQLFGSDSISKFGSAGKTEANGPSESFKAGFLEYANRKPFNVSTISSILSQKTQADIKEPSPRFFLSFGDCWSDPSVEFALETPTGTIPLKGDPLNDEFSMLHLQQQGSSKNQKDDRLALPDFCIPSSFQNDFFSYFNAPKKPPSQKQQISEQVPPLISCANVSKNQKDDRLALPDFCIPSSFQNDFSSYFNVPKKQPSRKQQFSQQVPSLLPSANVSAPPYIILNCQDVRLKGKTVRGRSNS